MMHTPTKDQIRMLLVIAIFTILSTTTIIAATVIKAAETSEQVRVLQSNHDASVCVLSLIHDITPAKGESEDQRRARYDAFFDDANLKAKCGLTDVDVRRVLAS